jgi:hypothetical protein
VANNPCHQHGKAEPGQEAIGEAREKTPLRSSLHFLLQGNDRRIRCVVSNLIDGNQQMVKYHPSPSPDPPAQAAGGALG